MSEPTHYQGVYHECEHCECFNEAIGYDEELESWLCGTHIDCCENKTGYCSIACQLGYGCDGSC
jgi:hypothetical protein